MHIKSCFCIAFVAICVPLASFAAPSSNIKNGAPAGLIALSSIDDPTKFLAKPPVKNLITQTMGKPVFDLFSQTMGNGPTDIASEGNERFLDTFISHNATQRAFLYIDLSNSRCIAACLDDADVSLYGATSKAGLPKLVKKFLTELESERGDSLNLPVISGTPVGSKSLP
jgi:hypothetical protein